MVKFRRSPNYPRVSLPRTIKRLRKSSSAIDQQVWNEDAIAHKIGYSGVTGASMPILSSLKKFGLLEVLEDGFRFSDVALQILRLNESDRQYAEIITELAYKPELYRQIRDRFGLGVPGTEVLSDFLRQKEFVPDSIPRVIKVLVQTFAMASALRERYDLPSESPTPSVPNGIVEAAVASGSAEKVGFKLAEGIEIVIRFTGTLTTDSVMKLTDFWNHNERFRVE